MKQAATLNEQVLPPVSSRAGYFRWAICALLLLGTTKNYMDRQVLGVLKTTLQHDFGWSEIDYSNLVIRFPDCVCLGHANDGQADRSAWHARRLRGRDGFLESRFDGDRIRKLSHRLRDLRFALGFGEAAVFPASIKAVAEWFPKRERALATGIFNAGTNAGAILAALLVPWIVVHWGWRTAFVSIGALGFVWLAFWLLIYRKPSEHPRVSKGELQYICSDPTGAGGKNRLGAPDTTAGKPGHSSSAKFLTDPVWWFYLFWVPGFLQTQHGLPLTGIGLPIVVIYVISDFGSVGGGWLSSSLIKRGRSVNTARKTAMLICAVGVIPVVFAYRVESTWSAVLLIGLAAACHQAWSANLYTLSSDMFPVQAVGSVNGIGGMAGAFGGICRRIRRRPRTSVDGKLQGSISHRRVGLFGGARCDSRSGSQAGTR